MTFSPGFASPEIANGLNCPLGSPDTFAQIDACAVDMWAVGCVLAFVVTGTSWFGLGNTLADVCQLQAEWVSKC